MENIGNSNLNEKNMNGGGQVDAIFNEIKNLENKINSLAQQNIKMYNELAKHHVILSKAIERTDNRINAISAGNLRYYLTQAASRQTAEFIIQNMSKVKFFDYGAEYYKYILSQTEDAGLFLEFGVFQGRTINLMSSIKADKMFYGFDSFEGLPEDWRSGFDKGVFNSHGNLPKVNSNVTLIKGWFNETLPNFVKDHSQKCAFIHVDCDLYSSTKTIFSALKNQIKKGTIIAFDEYFNYPGWQEGEYKALKEFAEETNLNFDYIAYTTNEQVTIKIK